MTHSNDASTRLDLCLVLFLFALFRNAQHLEFETPSVGIEVFLHVVSQLPGLVFPVRFPSIVFTLKAFVSSSF